MVQLNKVGEQLAKIGGVSAMTDVTGFGLLGHLIEMCEGSNLSAELYYLEVPVIDGAKEYLSQRIVPDATYRNWNSYSPKVNFEKGINVMEAFNLLPDPQTNGGLLIAVNENAVIQMQEIFAFNNLEPFAKPIGRFIMAAQKIICVKTKK